MAFLNKKIAKPILEKRSDLLTAEKPVAQQARPVETRISCALAERLSISSKSIFLSPGGV